MKPNTNNAVADLSGGNQDTAGALECLPSGNLTATISERGLVAAARSVQTFVEAAAARMKAERQRLLGN